MHSTDIGGTPAHLTSAAWETVMRSGAQGSIFPQALVEMFEQACVPVERVSLDCVAKDTIFAGAGPDEKVLVLTIEPKEKIPLAIDKGPYTAYINASDLSELRTGGKRGFHAVDTAREHVRLYKLFYEIR